MSRTRLAAAAGVAALTLGATAAVADDVNSDPQTVTIEVTAAARSITLGDPVADLTVVAGAEVSVMAQDANTTSTLAYNAGDAGAKITVAIAEDGNGLDGTDLTLRLAAGGMESNAQGTAANFFFFDADTEPEGAGLALVNSINAGAGATDKTVLYQLGGTAPSTAETLEVVLVFTISNSGS